jgi:RimJ/RimL family protein N-acetyltransferase
MSFPIPSFATRLETERLVLRPYAPQDATWYAEMSVRNRGHLRRFEAGNAAMTIESPADAERVLAEFTDGWTAGRAFFFGGFDKTSSDFVAQIYVGVANGELPEFELGFFADEAHEGQGWVTEAARRVLSFLFDELGARRVRLECDDSNLRSARVAELCGFRLEGHVRENHRWPDGSVTGTLHYGMLAREREMQRRDDTNG